MINKRSVKKISQVSFDIAHKLMNIKETLNKKLSGLLGFENGDLNAFDKSAKELAKISIHMLGIEEILRDNFDLKQDVLDIIDEFHGGEISAYGCVEEILNCVEFEHKFKPTLKDKTVAIELILKVIKELYIEIEAIRESFKVKGNFSLAKEEAVELEKILFEIFEWDEDFLEENDVIFDFIDDFIEGVESLEDTIERFNNINERNKFNPY